MHRAVAFPLVWLALIWAAVSAGSRIPIPGTDGQTVATEHLLRQLLKVWQVEVWKQAGFNTPKGSFFISAKAPLSEAVGVLEQPRQENSTVPRPQSMAAWSLLATTQPGLGASDAGTSGHCRPGSSLIGVSVLRPIGIF